MKSNEYKNSGRMSTMDQDKLSFNIFREKSKVFTKDCHREGLYTNQRQPSLKDQSVVTFETAECWAILVPVPYHAKSVSNIKRHDDIVLFNPI